MQGRKKSKLTGYSVWCNDNRPHLTQQYPNLSESSTMGNPYTFNVPVLSTVYICVVGFGDTTKKLAEIWENVSEKDKIVRDENKHCLS